MQLREGQKRAVDFLKKAHGKGALFLRPGYGKTVIVSTFLKDWHKKNKDKKILLIAPRQVIYDAWDIILPQWWPGVRMTNIHRDKNFYDGNDLYLINPEKFVSDFLNVSYYLKAFKALVVDESTNFKSITSKRTKAIHKFVDIFDLDVRIILTGTPITSNLLDLFSQMYIVSPEILGKNFYSYRANYFEPDFKGFNWQIKDGAGDEIISKIKPHAFIADEKKESDMVYPDFKVIDLPFKLSAEKFKDYKNFKETLILKAGDKYISRVYHDKKIYTGAIKYGYLSQFVSGNFYEPIFKEVRGEIKKTGAKSIFIHRERVKVLEDLIDSLDEQPLFVLYHYTNDYENFKKMGLGRKAGFIKGGMNADEVAGIIRDWNKKEIRYIFAQIQTVSHGLNLQFGGDALCFYNLPDRYDLYYQALHRLVRPGQTSKMVRIYRIICQGTIDEILRLQILNKKIFTAKQFEKKLNEIGDENGI